MKLPLPDLARAMDAGAAPDVEAAGYSIDTRTIRPGELFFALPGETHDGHEFVQAALGRGAVAAVVDRDMPGINRIIRVADVLTALQDAARWARNRWARTIVAVTGSAGKTTTKDVIGSLLASRFKVGLTTGNYNNHIGVPLSVLRIPDEAEVAVIELGMNHPGEIRALAEIARPDIGLVTNVGSAHVENFEDGIEGVALAKRELIEALPPGSLAILNGDDARVKRFSEIHPGRTVTFGLDADAQIRAENIETFESGVRFQVDGVAFTSSLLGRNGIRNVLAGIATALAFEIPLAALVPAVESLVPGDMRGVPLVHRGIRIINDCYNSNPEAVRSMLDVLQEIPAPRHIAVLGEMLELGRWSEPLHRDVGRYVAGCGVHVLVGIRGVARSMVQSAIEQGLGEGAAYFFEEPAEAGSYLRMIAKEGDAILFKGSRGTRVERALEKFLE